MKSILWVNGFCLLDSSSGASMAVRQMLLQLYSLGYKVQILGMTVFDDSKGSHSIDEFIADSKAKGSSILNIQDGPLIHELIRTESKQHDQITHKEMSLLFGEFLKIISKKDKPDIVFYFGGQILDFLIVGEAKVNNISTVAYLANGNYSGRRWCRDVDLIITDSQATSEFYKQRDGINVHPVGTFIDKNYILAPKRIPKNILFINPSLEKGVGVVIQIAILLEKIRPDIIIEVIESRGNWKEAVRLVTKKFGEERTNLTNVIITPNTNDMKPIYSRAKLIIVPSLWWESAGRVVAEALINGIPAIVTNRGGLPEMLGDAGLKINFPTICYEKPYTNLPKLDLITQIVDWIIQIYIDDSKYQVYVNKAKVVAAERHDIHRNTLKLKKVFNKII
jgi:glycosyltransferase involved in cell wall biosynthesis